MTENVPWRDPKAVEVTQEEFMRLYRAGEFTSGPWMESFGDGYGEPYNPNRKAGGPLKDGRIAWALV